MKAESGQPAGYYLKSDMVYEWLRESIVSGVFRQGERIVIGRVSSQFGVSDIPVREALKRLESEGLVEIVPHSGARVSTFDLKQAAEFFMIRSDLEHLAIRLAARGMDKKVIRALDTLFKKMEEAESKRDYAAYGRLNRQFHLTIYGSTPYRYLYDLIVSLWDRSEISRAVFIMVPERSRRSLDQHKEILEALKAGDSEKAGKILKAQKDEAFNLLLSRLEEEKAGRERVVVADLSGKGRGVRNKR